MLRDGMASAYKSVLLTTSMKGWKSKWFYTVNIEDSLSADIDSPTQPIPNWSMRPNSDEMHQVEELLDILIRTNIDGVRVTLNFIRWCLQPCKESVHAVYEYRDADFARETLERLTEEQIGERASKFFTANTK